MCDSLHDFSHVSIDAYFTHFQRPEESDSDDISRMESDDFCRDLVLGVSLHLDFVDARIGLASTHWSIARMARLDRNILRLGTYELAFRSDVPPKVVLNEAIELAKRFGSDDSPMFINGVLDNIASGLVAAPEAVEKELARVGIQQMKVVNA
jgi:transcription antitermination factor NusB